MVVDLGDEMRKNDVVWDWIPLIRVGPLRFAESKTEVQTKFLLENERWDNDRESVTYDIDIVDGYLTFYNDALSSVCLYECAQYKGVDLFGLTLQEFESLLGVEHDSESNEILLDDGSIIIQYEYKKSQVLVTLKDNVIDSIAFSNFDL